MVVPTAKSATLCFALAERPAPPPLPRGPPLRILVLDGLTDASNVGALVRVAAAFSASAVLLSRDCCDALGGRAVRASGGHAFHVPLLQADLVPLLLELRQQGVWLMAAIVQEASFLDEARALGRLALVPGGRGAGALGAARWLRAPWRAPGAAGALRPGCQGGPQGLDA